MNNYYANQNDIKCPASPFLPDFTKKNCKNGVSPQKLVPVSVEAFQDLFSTENKIAGLKKELMERQLMAIMVADVAGYCRLMYADETNTVIYLNWYKNIMARLINRYEGIIADACGDNLMAAFRSAENAVTCAVALQNRIRQENKKLSQKQRIHFRIGIHLGDVICRNQFLFGNTVNIAARLQSISEPGGIRISRAVYEQVEYKLKYEYCNLGERFVKNIPCPIMVYRVGKK